MAKVMVNPVLRAIRIYKTTLIRVEILRSAKKLVKIRIQDNIRSFAKLNLREI